MANRDFENRGERKLARVGGKSVGITLPIELVRQLPARHARPLQGRAGIAGSEWKVRQKVMVKRFGKNWLVVEDWKDK